MKSFVVRDSSSKVIVPEHGQQYWTIFHDGEPFKVKWMGSYADRNAYEFGNVFLTSTDAAIASERMKAVLHKLHEDIATR